MSAIFRTVIKAAMHTSLVMESSAGFDPRF